MSSPRVDWRRKEPFQRFQRLGQLFAPSDRIDSGSDREAMPHQPDAAERSTARPMWQAQRYGFLVYDIQGTAAAEWQKLAIVAKVDEWTQSALQLVRELADDVIVLDTDHEEHIEQVLPGKMTELTAAAQQCPEHANAFTPIPQCPKCPLPRWTSWRPCCGHRLRQLATRARERSSQSGRGERPNRGGNSYPGYRNRHSRRV